MKIFSKKITKESNDVVFVGANMPLQSNVYLTLYSIATGISKSKIVSNLVSNFKEQTEIEISLEELINQVAVKASEAFKIESKKVGFSTTKFYNEMHSQLNKKGIDGATCTEIINNVKNEAKHK